MNDTKTVSGNIVHIEDGSEAPVLSLKVAITPKQSGTGTPSPDNVRQISGWESVQTSVSGKNLLNNNRQSTTLNGVTFTRNDDGSILANGTATANVYLLLNTSGKFEAKAGVSYRLTGCPSGGGSSTYIIYNDSHGLSDSGNGATYTPTANDSWEFFVRVGNGATLNNVLFKPMLRVKKAGDSDEYEPYNGTINTTALGGTVYGGTLDVVSGVLTVTKVGVDLGSLTWSKYGDYTDKDRYITTGIDSNVKNDEANAICSIYPRLWGANGWWIGSGSGKLSIFTTYGQYSSVSAFKTAMSGQILCYPLATPQTYQLTPTEVSTLLGENNVWADAGPILEMTYRTEMLGIFGKIMIDGRPYFRPNNFELKREDVYAGEYTTCTGKLIADKIGWKFSDLAMKWDILPDDDLLYLSTLTGTFDIIFRDSDGQHTETVIRKGFTNTPTRITGPGGTAIWTGVEMEVTFINVHNN